MTTTSTFVGIAEAQRVSSRVLKPPGGGSSISFGDDGEDFMKPKAKTVPVQQAPQGETKEEAPKADTNGTETSQSDSAAAATATETATATKENNPVPATNGSTTSGCSTPTSARVDTQSRLFGEQPRETPGRKVRDHQKSNIFAEDNAARSNGATNGSPRAAGTPVASETPVSKSPEQPQPQQKQRIPPGGFSTKLW